MSMSIASSIVLLLGLLLLFGDLLVRFLEFESIRVEFVYIEIMFFGKKAIDGNFKEPHCLFPIISEVRRKHLEDIGATMNVSRDFIGNFIDEGKSFIFCLNLIKFHILDFLYYEVVYLNEFIDDAGML